MIIIKTVSRDSSCSEIEVNADGLVNQDMAFKADEDGVLIKMKLELALQDLDIAKEENGGIE